LRRIELRRYVYAGIFVLLWYQFAPSEWMEWVEWWFREKPTTITIGD
jgi:hypothetical protein